MNRVKTVALLTALAAPLVVLGGFFGGKTGATIALVFALATNFGSYWFSDRLALRMYHAHEVTESDAPDLHRLVELLAAQARMPMLKVYIIPDESPMMPSMHRCRTTCSDSRGGTEALQLAQPLGGV
jgi:heat shock protein HtpX